MSQPKICPLRMLAHESDSDNVANCGIADHFIKENNHNHAELGCIGDNCAWWNIDFGQCALTALSIALTRPVVHEEMRG